MSDNRLVNFQIKNGTIYRSNYARAVAYFLSTSDIDNIDKLNIEEKAAANFLLDFYLFLGNNIQSIGLKEVEDKPFGPWEQQNGKEKEIKVIRDTIKKVEEFVKNLYDLISKSEIVEQGLKYNDYEINRTFLKLLKALNIEIKDNIIQIDLDCAKGLKKLAQVSKENTIKITEGPLPDKEYLFFSRITFNPKGDWIINRFDKALDSNGLLSILCSELEKRGYQKILFKDGKRASLDYVKQHGKKVEPVKMAWAERTHTGIEVSYEDIRLEPCFLWVRMPYFKEILENVDKLPTKAKEFIKHWTKNCEGCHYCIQTDKTKTKPLAFIKIDDAPKCPYFPGFTMNWRMINKDLVDNIIFLVDALDKYLD